MRTRLNALAALIALATTTLAAEPVIGFRNNGTGAYPDADPPMVWSCTSNVVWRWQQDPLTAFTISSVIVVGDRLFTLGHPMTFYCLDKNTGKELWRREAHLHESIGETAKAMHEALLRDGRIHALSAMGLDTRKFGKEGGARIGPPLGVVLSRPGQIRREMIRVEKNKARGYEQKPWATEAEAVHFEKLGAELKALQTHSDEERAALEKELEELGARVPGRKDPGFHARGYTCGATPASDGERVVAVFLPGLVVCYDLEGNLQWTHAVVDSKGKPGAGGTAIVPAVARSTGSGQADGKVVVDVNGIVRCLDMKTGAVVWNREGIKQEGFGGAAASPVIGHNGDRFYVMVTQKGDVWDLDTGEDVVPSWWRDETEKKYHAEFHSRYWASGVTADGKTLHGISHAVRIPDDPNRHPHILWKLPIEYVGRKDKPKKVVGGNHQYCAPMIADGKIHFWNTGGGPHRMTKLDAETGAILAGPFTEGFEGNYPDPILAGKYVYRFDAAGNCRIRDPEKDYEVIAENKLEPGLNQVPVFEGKRMYIRTDISVFCIEKPKRK